jgi:prefoldin alpha subunit
MAEGEGSRKMSREELAYMERVYQNQYMMVGNAINSALEELQELNSASKSLEEMDKVAGKESFASVGADFYLRSQIKSDSKVIVGVGGGFLIEKPVDQAKAAVKKRIDAKNEMVNKLVKSRKELETAILGLESGVAPEQGSG